MGDANPSILSVPHLCSWQSDKLDGWCRNIFIFNTPFPNILKLLDSLRLTRKLVLFVVSGAKV